MDFSNDVFRSRATAGLSNDTMNHGNMVMACRFGWTAGPVDGTQTAVAPAATQPEPARVAPATSSQTTWAKRSAPCRGRLYHQLMCSHKVRTDFVVPCGTNCLEPLESASDPPFYCHQCVEDEANRFWTEYEAQHNATYPPRDQMTAEQSSMWYHEHRQLEAQFEKDKRMYQLEQQSKSRPANTCSALEASEDEVRLSNEIDSLSLAMASSNTPTGPAFSQSRPTRISLPNDASEQLHWGLNSLSIDRGACGVEYAGGNPSTSSTSAQRRLLEQEELWGRSRQR